MSIDAVYNIGPHPGPELRYSLRTLKNLPSVGKVWVMSPTPLPKWLQNVEWIQREHDDKWMGLHSSFIQMCQDERLTPKVYLMEDDHFVLRPQKKLPNYYNGTLVDACFNRPKTSGEWGAILANTLGVLTRAGVKDPLYFETHIPMLINRKKAPVHLDEGIPVRWPNVYGNMVQKGAAVKHVNVKAVTNIDLVQLLRLNTDFLSSLDSTFKLARVQMALELLFPEKSKYER